MGGAVMRVDPPQQRLTGQLATGQVHHGEGGPVLGRLLHPVGGVGRAGRDRPPGPRIGPDPGRHIVIQLGVQDRDIFLLPGPQPRYFSAQHAMFLPEGRRGGKLIPPGAAPAGVGLGQRVIRRSFPRPGPR